MKKLWRTAATVAVVVAGATLEGRIATAADAPPATESVTVTLHVTDYANVARTDLAVAEAYASAIYRVAGIRAVWTDTPWSPSDDGSPHLRVVILSPDMTAKKCKQERLGNTVLGTAIAGAPQDSARIAYIFVVRIVKNALQNLARFDQSLGHVLAHEVGHLLLGERSHAPAGLMRDYWNPRDPQITMLTSEQVRVIRLRAAPTPNK